MCDSMAQQTRHAPWFWTRTTETEKGWRKGEDQGRLTALVWNERQEVYMDSPPAERNFCDENNSPMKPHAVECYNRHMAYIDNSDHMANSYSMNWHTFKWTTKLFFHLLDLTLLNSWIPLPSCEAKYTHWDISLLLVRNLIEEAEKSHDHPTPRLVGRPSAAATNAVCLRNHHKQCWRGEKKDTRIWKKHWLSLSLENLLQKRLWTYCKTDSVMEQSWYAQNIYFYSGFMQQCFPYISPQVQVKGNNEPEIICKEETMV